MITINELFSGVGTQSLAFEYMGLPHKVVGIAEISEPAIKAYEVLHGPTRNYGDVSKVDKLDYADFWTYSFPCFTGNMGVVTKEGYKRIDLIEIGDEVVTYKNRWRRVMNFFEQGEKEIYEVGYRGVNIETTKNHKFWVRIKTRKGYFEPRWMEAGELREGDLMAVSKHSYNRPRFPEEYVMEDELFYWVGMEYARETGRTEKVYDIEVEDDHSFVVEGVVAHNCQDLSTAGRQEGIAEGTRSGLVWEVGRLLKAAKEHRELPKYLLMENVPALLYKKHKPMFDIWCGELEKLGYTNTYEKMNARDYGVPQNRDRLFMVSIHKDAERGFDFGNIEKQPTPCFSGFLEKEVVEYRGEFKIDTTIIPSVVKAYEECLEGIIAKEEGIFSCKATSNFQDKKVGITYSPTIRSANNHTAILYNNQIHKLTAREAWMFMGIRDEDYLKVVEGTGLKKTRMLSLAGNAIVVSVLMAIYQELFAEELKQQEDISGLKVG